MKKDNGNKATVNVCGIHKYSKNHCEDAAAFGSVGEYVNNIDEDRQLNKIKNDRLLITEDDYDRYIFPMSITKHTNHIDLLHIVDETNENEEFDKDNGNRISINVYGIHNDIKKHSEDSLVGEYVNNMGESSQLSNI